MLIKLIMSLGAGLAIAGSALASLAGGIGTNMANANLNYRNRKWQEEMWQKQNEYNSPSAVLSRYAQAGIGVNPNYLVTGNYDGGLAQHVGTPQQQGYRNPMEGINLYQSIAQSKQLENETAVAQSQKELNDANARKADAEATRLNLENGVLPERLTNEMKILGLDAQIKDLEFFVKDQTYNDEIEQIFQSTQQLILDTEIRNEEKKIVIQKLANLGQEYNNLVSQGKVIEAEEVLTKAKTLTEQTAQTKNLADAYYSRVKASAVPSEIALNRANARKAIADAIKAGSDANLNDAQVYKIANDVEEQLYNGNTKRALDILQIHGNSVIGSIERNLKVRTKNLVGGAKAVQRNGTVGKKPKYYFNSNK